MLSESRDPLHHPCSCLVRPDAVQSDGWDWERKSLLSSPCLRWEGRTGSHKIISGSVENGCPVGFHHPFMSLDVSYVWKSITIYQKLQSGNITVRNTDVWTQMCTLPLPYSWCWTSHLNCQSSYFLNKVTEINLWSPSQATHLYTLPTHCEAQKNIKTQSEKAQSN